MTHPVSGSPFCTRTLTPFASRSRNAPCQLAQRLSRVLVASARIDSKLLLLWWGYCRCSSGVTAGLDALVELVLETAKLGYGCGCSCASSPKLPLAGSRSDENGDRRDNIRDRSWLH